MSIIGYILLFVINSLLLLLAMRVILSWLVLPPSIFTHWLFKITDPVLIFFKKRFPLRVGILDLSILIPFFILSILNKIISDFFIHSAITRVFFYIIEIAFFIIDSVFVIVLTIFFIFTIVYLLITIFSVNSYNPMITSIKSAIEPIILKIRRLMRINSIHSEKIYLIILAICIIIIGLIGHFLLLFILSLLSSVIKF